MKTNPNDLIDSFADSIDARGNFNGLSKREHFAAMAMQGLLAGIYSDEKMLNEFKRETGRDHVSINATSYADALIAELNKEQHE